jgi:hypothetical protein
MNHIFKKIWNKSLGRIIVVSENAKSAGKTDNTTGTTENSLSNVQCDERGKNGVFSFKPFVLQILALSVAMILGGNTQADDNYAGSTTDTAVGSAKGTEHGATYISGKITAVGGIKVTTTGAGTSLDDIDAFTVNSVTTTKTANPTAVAAFINAAKKGGNIAVGQYSSAMGTGNIASGSYNSAMGMSNIASGTSSSAVGYSNTVEQSYWSGMGNNAFGSYNKNYGEFYNTAMGVGNIVNYGSWGTNAIGYSNSVGNFVGSALGTANTVQTRGSNAVGFSNLVSGGYYANAFGTGNTAMGQNTAAVGSGLASYGGSYYQQISLTPAYTPTMITVGGVTALDGVVIETTAANWSSLQANPSLLTKVNGQVVTAAQAANIVKSFEQGGNLALADRSSVFGINSKAVATGATAIGLNSVADRADTISVGKAGAEKQITNVKAGTADTDAVNKKQLDTALTNFTGNADTVLYDTASNKATLTLAGANGTKITNLQDATLDATSKDAVTGKQLHATNTALTDGLALKADQTALTTGLANSLTDAKGYTDVEVGKLDTKLGTEVGNLNTAITNSANTINTRIDGVDTRIGNEVTTLNTRVDTTNTALVQALGGGAAWNNGVFTNPTFTIQGKAKNTVSDAFIAVDQQLGAIKTSVSDLKTHTDQQAVSNLNDAKNYADQQTTTALNNAKGYTDQKTTSTLNDAKSYADQKAADGKAYTDQQTTSTLNSAKNYADQKAADGKAYTDQQTASVLNDAKSYTDQKAASSLSGAKDYTDQQTASALSSANSYTDGKIADVQTQIIASNQFVQVNGVTDAQAASATGANSVAIGANTVVTGHRSTAVGVGNQVSGNGSGAFGDPNTVSGNGSYVVGNDNKVTGDNTFVLGNNVDTQAKNAVVLGNDSASDRDNTVSVGAKGKERQIIHVADAVEDTDAVNYQQLKAAERSTNSYTNERVNALNSAFNDYRMETEQRFHKVDERFNRQGAMTAAMMNMSSSAASVKGQNRVGVGAGFQGQEQAVSIGYQRIINDNTSLTIGGAFTKEESSGGVGVGFGW